MQTAFANPDIQYEAETRIVQIMRWEPQNDVLNYELKIERLEQGQWHSALTQITEKNEVRTMLPPGEYRYRVDIIDLLGRRRNPAEWSRLTVLRALKPELYSFSPSSHNIKKGELTVAFKGKSIETNARIFLVSSEGERINAESVEINTAKDGGKAVFGKDSLKAGYWSLLARNPGGLETALPTLALVTGDGAASADGISAAAERPSRFWLQEGYAILFPLRGTFAGFFDSPFYPAGAAFRFAFLPLRKDTWALGFEIEPSWTYMESSGIYDDIQYESVNYVVSAHFFTGSLNLFFQKRLLGGRLALNARAGGGMTFLYDLRVRQQDDRNQWLISGEQFSGLVPLVNASLSVSWIWRGRYFLDLAFEGRLLLTDNYPLYGAPVISFGLVL
ncbi:MAG: hypothetical protein LBG72_05775 [Spirochaetaceae bacterium]|nr:hypothetical protein [Spirochaetaceae bacterium]